MVLPPSSDAVCARLDGDRKNVSVLRVWRSYAIQPSVGVRYGEVSIGKES